MADLTEGVLGADEMQIFNEEVGQILRLVYQDREVDLTVVYPRLREYLLKAVRIGKSKFGVPFQGLMAMSGFGWQLMRPEDVNPVPVLTLGGRLTWFVTQGAGWQPYDGLWGANTQGNPCVVDEQTILVHLGFIELSASPLISAAQLTVSQADYPVEYFEDVVRLSDIPAYLHSVPIYLMPKDIWQCWVKFDANSGILTEELQQFGVKIATANRLKNRVPFPAQ